MEAKNLLEKAVRDLQESRSARQRAQVAWASPSDEPREEVEQLSLDDQDTSSEEPVGEPVKSKRRKDKIFEDVASFCADMTVPPQLIDGVLPEDSVVALFGQANCGKSFLAIDLACSVATGLSWQGRAVSEGPVIYLAGEGRSGLQKRINAWQEQFGVIQPHRMQVSTRGADLTNEGDVSAVSDALKSITKRTGEDPKLIVIDTLARHFGESDESSTKDMNKFVGLLDHLRRSWDCTILIIHHSGKDESKGMRGAGSLRAAVDVEYSLTNQDGILTLACTKMKDSSIPEAIVLQLEEVQLESVVKPTGEPVTTCIVRGQGEEKKVKGSLQGSALTFWESFLEVERAARLLSESEDQVPLWYLIKNVNQICGKKGISRSMLSHLRSNYRDLYSELHSLLSFEGEYVARRSAIDVSSNV